MAEYRFCPQCASPLAWLSQMEDGGETMRLRCTACDFTHWNNPTPVLAAVVEYQGKILLARNAAWSGEKFALITGFMEAGETPQEGIRREIMEETSLQTSELNLVGVYDFQRMNQVIIAYPTIGDRQRRAQAIRCHHHLSFGHEVPMVLRAGRTAAAEPCRAFSVLHVHHPVGHGGGVVDGDAGCAANGTALKTQGQQPVGKKRVRRRAARRGAAEGGRGG